MNDSIKKTNEIDAGDLVLESFQEEEKPLSDKLDKIFRPLVRAYYSEKLLHLKFIKTQYGPYSIDLDEYLKSPYFLKMIAPSGTGDIQNYLVEKILFKDNIIKLDEKLRKYSEGIVGLPDNWDEEGSKAITIEAWNYTTSLLREILYDLWYNGFDISTPIVLHNTDGSFDIDWETEDFQLLLSIPTNIKELVHIYGEKSGQPEYELEVRINYELVQGVIVEWMKKIL